MRLLATLLLVMASMSATALAKPAAMPVDMSLGNPRARVQIVEYASLSCSHCAHFNETVYPQLKAKYVDTGKARYTIREMMTHPTEVAAAGWLLARCAGPKQYFAVVDQVFRSQSRWSTEPLMGVFYGIGAANGLDKPTVDACLRDDAGLAALNAKGEAAAAAGVRGTPTFYVNGKQVEGDIMSLKAFDAAIAAALAAKRGRR